MKKQLSLAMMLVLWTSIVSAAWVDYSRVFDERHDFGYTSNVNISIAGYETAEDSSNVLKIESPVLRDGKDTAVGEYHIIIGEKPIKNYIDDKRDDLKDLRQVQIMELDEKIDLSIKESEVTSDRSYYGIIVPVNDNIAPGDYSDEFCFDFGTLTYDIGDKCNDFGRKPEPTVTTTVEEKTEEPATTEEPTTTKEQETTEVKVALNEEDEHGAADGADMSMADISHSVNGNVVTLTWTAVPYSDNVEIRIFDKVNADYVTLGTVPMTAEKFNYTTKSSDGDELLFAFIPRDAKGREYRYDVNVRHESDVTPEIKATPKVGPAEDFAVMLLITVALYLGYRVFASRKAS